MRWPVEAVHRREAQVGVERVPHCLDEAVGAPCGEALLPPETEHLDAPAVPVDARLEPADEPVPKTIGSTYQPKRRFAGGWKRSQT